MHAFHSTNALTILYFFDYYRTIILWTLTLSTLVSMAHSLTGKKTTFALIASCVTLFVVTMSVHAGGGRLVVGGAAGSSSRGGGSKLIPEGDISPTNHNNGDDKISISTSANKLPSIVRSVEPSKV